LISFRTALAKELPVLGLLSITNESVMIIRVATLFLAPLLENDPQSKRLAMS
jgi:hypothetical protein